MAVQAEEPPPDLTLPKTEREFPLADRASWQFAEPLRFRSLGRCGARRCRRLDRVAGRRLRARTPRQPREVRLDSDLAVVLRQQDAGPSPLRLSAEEFVAYLLKYRRLFPQPPQVKLALMSLSPDQRDKLDGPWSGTCQLRMWGETSPSQPAEIVLYLQYRLPRPTQERLSQKGWLHECRILQSQQAKATHFLLREATRERGIEPRRFHDNWRSKDSSMFEAITGGVYLCDYDRDGILDMLVTDITGYILYHGRPDGKFEDATLSMGLLGIMPMQSGPKLLAAFADFDGDGWEDLLLDDHLYRNDSGHRFVDVTARTNLEFAARTPTGSPSADFDRDGRIDLYVTRPGSRQDGLLDRGPQRQRGRQSSVAQSGKLAVRGRDRRQRRRRRPPLYLHRRLARRRQRWLARSVRHQRIRQRRSAASTRATALSASRRWYRRPATSARWA